MSLHHGLVLNSPPGRTVRFELTDAACRILSLPQRQEWGVGVRGQLISCGRSR